MGDGEGRRIFNLFDGVGNFGSSKEGDGGVQLPFPDDLASIFV